VLNLYLDVSGGIVVYPAVVKRNLDLELPFLATENVMMEAVKAGGDRQDLHERIRVHSHAAAAAIKEGGESDLSERLQADPAFSAVASRMHEILDGSLFVGRAPEQVIEFMEEEVDPILERYNDLTGVAGDVRV